MKKIIHGILDLLLPVRCIFCGESIETSVSEIPICRADIQTLPRLQPPQCFLCGLPLQSVQWSDPHVFPRDPRPLCGDCRQQKMLQSFTLAPFAYTGKMKKIVADWKFGFNPEWGRFLGELLVDSVSDFLKQQSWDAIVPVPLHEKRLQERGFNQASQLATCISKKLNIELKHLLVKTKRTVSQAKLSREDRLRNLKGAFKLVDGVEVSGKILIVDDIFTTGSTIQAASARILGTDADEVAAVVLARSLPRRLARSIFLE